MPRPVALAAILVALVFAAPAAAHVTATPGFISADSTTSLSFTGPNERDEQMTGFAVTVPNGFLIVEAAPSGTWRSVVEGGTATWSGGSLAPGAEASFTLQLEASVEPGVVQLEAEQLYPGGDVVRWPIAMTVTPGSTTNEAGRGASAPARFLVFGGLGLFAVAAIVFVIRRRRRRSLQER